ncbi:actin-like [Acropora millepora]|uniref:actin-like n=1 Tax=Acropora millepora TaxID=45264 RepID=UPI001CF3C88D|nr:actin-like [Acropora millepora]
MITDFDGMEEVIFETFDSPAMYLALAPVLALYASGRKSGVTLDSGHGSTNSVPIHEGFAVVKNILRVDLGGEYLTDYLKTSLVEKDDSLAGVSREVVRDIKESLCYLDYVLQCDEGKQQELHANIVVAEGNTMFEE